MNVTWHASPNHSPRPEGTAIDAIVIHYTDLDLPDTLARLCDPAIQASTHYVITRRGRLLQLVPEDRKAWHAGVSALAGRPAVNEFAIGIDLVFQPGRHPGYTDSQYRTLLALLQDLCARHGIRPDRIVGHEDVALPPGRKQDPGPRFDWSRVRRQLGGRGPGGTPT
jgi:N-acetylmuramoyl-L-alanine amidase